MNRLALLAAAGVLVTLAACSSPPTSGTVEHRQYSSPYTYITTPCTYWATRSYTTYSGGRLVTRTSSYCAAHVVHVNHMPATYGLCLRHDKAGEQDGCFDTDQVTYDRYPEGSHYP